MKIGAITPSFYVWVGYTGDILCLESFHITMFKWIKCNRHIITSESRIEHPVFYRMQIMLRKDLH